ncbi:MAG: hypothetical protein PWQ57_145 [Desulfovibrionales bacterium]|nr:hypothetical protein [Desulfovibrionales bacterium]
MSRQQSESGKFRWATRLIPRAGWRRRLFLAAFAVCCLLAAYALCVGVIAPPVARPRIEKALSGALGRNASLEHLSLNPFTFEATLSGLAIDSLRPGRKLLAIDSLSLDFDPWGLLFHEIRISDILIENPVVLVVRLRDNTLNLQPLLAHAAGDETADPTAQEQRSRSEPFRFSLAGVKLQEGEIRFLDEYEGSNHTISRINISLPLFGDTPALRVEPAKLSFSGNVDGAGMEAQGRLSPFAGEDAYAFTLAARNITLAQYQPYLPREVGVYVRSGRMDCNATLALARKNGPMNVLASASFRFRNLSTVDSAGDPLADLQDFTVQGCALDLLARRVHVDQADVRGPRLRIVRQEDGSLNFARLGVDPASGNVPAGASNATAGAPQGKASGEQASGEPVWSFGLDRFNLGGGRVEFADHALRPSLNATVRDIFVEVRDARFNNTFAAQAGVSCLLEDRTRFRANARVRGEPLEAWGRASFTNLQPARLLQAYAPELPVALANATLEAEAGVRLLLAGDASADPLAQLRLSNASAGVRGLVLQERDGSPLLRLDEFAARGVDFDLSGRSLRMRRLKASNGGIELALDDKGELEEAELFASNESNAPGDAQTPWRVRLDDASLSGFALRLQNPGFKELPELRLENAAFTLKHLALGPEPEAKEAEAALSFDLPPEGRVEANGSFRLTPLSAGIRLKATNIPLSELSGLAKGRAGFTIPRGSASAEVSARIRGADGRDVHVSGDLGLRHVALRDEATGYIFAGVAQGAFAGVEAGLDPLKVSARRISIMGTHVNLVRTKNGTLALPSPPENGKEEGSEPRAEEENRFEDPKPLPFQVEEWLVRDGLVEFSDYTTTPPVQVRVSDLHANATKLPSGDETPGEFHVAGRLGDEGAFRMRGAAALQATELDVGLKGDHIELTTLSPYAVELLGRNINRGQAALDMNYHIHGAKLKGDNNILLENFHLGRQEGGGILGDVSIGAALSLLRDSDGVVQLNIPVSGNLRDPSFDYTRVLARAFTGSIQSVLSAPFQFLKLPLSLIGTLDSGRQVAYAPFLPGDVQLTHDGRRELEKLAKALQPKTEIRVAVTGCVGPVVDREGLARFAYLYRLKALKEQRELAQGKEDAQDAPLTVGDERKYLPFVYREVTGQPAPLSFSEDEDISEWSEEVVAAIQPTPAERTLFGMERAKAVEACLAGFGLDPTRVDVIRPDTEACSAAPGAPRSRAQLSVEY